MQYGLGIDLGTTQTAAAVRVDGRVEVVRLGGRRAEIPSLVFVKPDGGLLIGEAAERRGQSEPARLAREFKRRMGDPVPIMVGGSPFSAHALTAKLLRHVLDTVTSLQGGPPAAITVTHPANWGPYKKEQLDQAIKQADAGPVRLVSEPEAAALQHATARRIASGETVAVYDLGGGTFDVAVLRRDGDGFTVLGEPEGIEQLGGIDFDEAVFSHVLETLGSMAEGLDPSDPEVTAALARLRRDCVEAKESLSFDTETMIPVALPGLHTRVRLNRSELEAMIAPSLTDTVAATQRALRTAGVTPDQLSAILLAGGSSRIPMVSQLLSTEFQRPVVADPHPEHSIALGAAVATAGVLGGASPFSAAVPPPRSPADNFSAVSSPQRGPAPTNGSAPVSGTPTPTYGNAPVSGTPAPTYGNAPAGGAPAYDNAQPSGAPAPTYGNAPISGTPAANYGNADSAPAYGNPPVSGAPAPTYGSAPVSGTPAPTYGNAPISGNYSGPATSTPPQPGPVSYSRGSAAIPGAGSIPGTASGVGATSMSGGAAVGSGPAPVSGASGVPQKGAPTLLPPPGGNARPDATPPFGNFGNVGNASGAMPWPPPPLPGTKRNLSKVIMIAALAVAVLAGAATAGLILFNRKSDDDKATGGVPPASAPATTAAATQAFPLDKMLIRVDTGGEVPPSRKSKIYSFTPGDPVRTPLAGSEVGDALPKWSHKRDQIAITHVSADGKHSSIYVMKADGSDRRIAIDNAGGRVAWSADDTKMAFMKKDAAGRNQIFVLTLANGNLRQLTKSTDTKDDAMWSPDGTSIVYWLEKDKVKQIYELNVADPQEPGHRITGPEIGEANDPSYSPDNKQILFTLELDNGKTSDIWLVNRDGSNPHRVTSNPAREMDPTWSPDGKWFAFVRGDYGHPTVVIQRPDGSGETVLTATARREGHPCWY